jgi:hypothetical protein|tara:strand:- start:510 stop:866 length:357 start_codon:yes stop_codon:yes gene_type:complete
MANINIDGKEYDIDALPPEVKGQLAALQQCDQKIKSWNMNIALAQTARGAYAAELNLLLEKVAAVGAEKVEVVEAEEVDEVDEVEILSAEEVDEIDEVEILSAEEAEVLETEEIEANR